jgi:excisionase family DNA binding protein
MNQSLLEPFSVSVQEAARLMGVCRVTVYEAIARGELIALKDGSKRGKTKVTLASIKAREASLPPAQIKRRAR